MRIGIDCGHTKYAGSLDYGAVGIKAESDLTREVGNLVIAKLKQLGHMVINCTVDNCSSLQDSLSRRVSIANNNNLDFYISIHFNCFNGQAHGTEIFTYGGKRYKQVNDILNNLVSLGFTNRGIKDGSGLYVINNTNCEAMLIEICFCDNKLDMNIFNSEKVVNAIVKGIVGKSSQQNITNKEDVYDMDKIVVYYGDVDVFAAVILAQKLECALIKESSFGNIKAKEIIRVGGPNSSYGKGDRFYTFKSVASKL